MKRYISTSTIPEFPSTNEVGASLSGVSGRQTAVTIISTPDHRQGPGRATSSLRGLSQVSSFPHSSSLPSKSSGSMYQSYIASDKQFLRPEDSSCEQETRTFEKEKKILRSWKQLKRLKELYNERIIKEQSKCLRKNILMFMRDKIIRMQPEERHQWVIKLIRLGFLLRLKEIRDIKVKKRYLFFNKLKAATGEEKEILLQKLAKLKDLHELQELNDVEEMVLYKRLKRAEEVDKAQRLEMLMKIKRLGKAMEIRKKEKEELRKETLEDVKSVVKTRSNWQDEIIDKLMTISKQMTDEIAYIEDRSKWYVNTKKRLEEEQRKRAEADSLALLEAERRINEKVLEKQLKREKKDKLEVIERCQKERLKRLWKTKKIVMFDRFLEKREEIHQMDENAYFQKVFDKLTSTDKKIIEVDPWSVKKIPDTIHREKIEQSKLNKWIHSIMASNKRKVLNKIKLKKYLELMATPQADKFLAQWKLYSGVMYMMCVVENRIFKNTFPEKAKLYIARTFGQISVKAKRDIKDIDPEDELVNIQISTFKFHYCIGTGNEFMTVLQQKIPDDSCVEKEKEGVLLLSKEDKDKIMSLVKKREETRKVVKERRQVDYLAHTLRRAMDETWTHYVKAAMEAEAPCWLRGRREGAMWQEPSALLLEPREQVLVHEPPPADRPPERRRPPPRKLPYEQELLQRRRILLETVKEKGQTSGKHYLRQSLHHKAILDKAPLLKNDFAKEDFT